MLVRVFQMPDLMSGYLFEGGVPFPFLQVDWFRVEGVADEDIRTELTEFIKGKRYYDPERPYLVLHPTHPFTINYEEG